MTTSTLERPEIRGTYDLFAGASPKQRVAIRGLATELAVAPGRVLLREGAPNRQFFVVEAGRARVTIRGVYVRCIEAGSFAGEMSLFDPRPCVATVTAATPMLLLVFGRQELRALLNLHVPGLTERMLRTVGERLRTVDARFASVATAGGRDGAEGGDHGP